MKISIDTLPLWDAFRQTELCPFCHLEHRLEELFIDTYLGDSVMEPDVRVEVNKKGFCRDHYALLYRQKTSKLGLALMTHTHLKETIGALGREMDALEKRCAEGDTLIKRAAGAREFGSLLDGIAAAAERRKDACMVCERMALHMERYYETALDMWERDADFARLAAQAKGFCIPHWGRQLAACKGLVMSKKRIEFMRMLNEKQKESLAELEKDLEWFTRKFDYLNTDKPWGNSKDALPRAINVLEGEIIRNE